MTGDTSLPSVKMINALSPIFFSFAVVSSWRKGKPGEISDGSTTFWRDPPGAAESLFTRGRAWLKKRTRGRNRRRGDGGGTEHQAAAGAMSVREITAMSISSVPWQVRMAALQVLPKVE